MHHMRIEDEIIKWAGLIPEKKCFIDRDIIYRPQFKFGVFWGTSVITLMFNVMIFADDIILQHF